MFGAPAAAPCSPALRPAALSVNKVQVIARCRPLNKREQDANEMECVDVDPEQNIITLIAQDNKALVPDGAFQVRKVLKFDAVLPKDADDERVYDLVARKVIEGFLQRVPGTVFAYGQTGTGKTFTMRSIVLRAFVELLKPGAIPAGGPPLVVEVVDIYRPQGVGGHEKIRDLLSAEPGERLLVLGETPQLGVFAMGATRAQVDGMEDVNKLLKLASKNRPTASHAMNEHSSRSHMIITAALGNCKLQLVDLAGSERLKQSQAQGGVAQQAIGINSSLTHLTNVITSLARPGRNPVCWRASATTRFLKNGLDGRAQAALVITVGPASSSLNVTEQSLMWGDAIKQIKVAPMVAVEAAAKAAANSPLLLIAEANVAPDKAPPRISNAKDDRLLAGLKRAYQEVAQELAKQGVDARAVSPGAFDKPRARSREQLAPRAAKDPPGARVWR